MAGRQQHSLLVIGYLWERLSAAKMIHLSNNY
jgi:hypothetical protein